MLKAAAIKVTGWSNNFCCVFHCDRCFYLWFCNRTFKETVGKLLEAKIMSQYWAAQTVAGNPNIVQCVCATGRAGLSNAKKKKKFPTNEQWSSQFVIYGFHSFSYCLAVFPVLRSTKVYHEDDFPHKIPELRYYSWLLNIQFRKQETEGLNHQWHTGTSEKLS